MEHKFKAKAVYGNEWVFGSFIHDIWFISRSNEYRIRDQETGIEHDIHPKTVCKLVKVVNGIEIYEGDMDSEGNFVVYCEDCNGYEFATPLVNCQRCNGDFFFEDLLDYFSPINNIHDLV
jgi:hypothetical protein